IKVVMQLSVKGKQLDVGDALRTHVDESLSRILGKYFGNALEVTVTLSRDAHLYRAVISAHVGRGIQLEAHGERSEEHTSELQSLMRISYAVFCLKKKKTT